MSIISEKNLEKIKSNVLRVLYDESPSPISANYIADVEARDKQFILKILNDFEKKKIVRNTTKSFSRKSFWIMTDEAYVKYKELL